ncbi:pyridoxal phosphate-dependent aminotransferase [Shimia ponticola]|uniref:pyridoxal phosphate-dependent aminotransferase n=1 Tax=Shimia ponticola TaxID=2582893 RepID=UPI0011BD9516|nr:pyridoxal phosphate-dependent aminotransferase [Shimia ponticola]
MHVSRTLTSLTDDGDDGWGLFYEARRRVAAGEPIVELTIGEHDIKTHPSILAAMHASATGGHLGYASVPGTPQLRDAVARRVTERTGVETYRDNVVITPGGQSALFASHLACLSSGDVGLFLDPYYATYPGSIRGSGAVARAVPCHAQNGFQPRLSDLEAAAKGAKSLLINTPNNPTGVVYSKETVAMLGQFAIDHDLWLISDEVYDTQVWDGAHVSPRALPGLQDRTLVIGSMSKSHAMTGSRVGWVVGPKDVIAHLINLSTHTTYGVPGYIQDAALFALDQGFGLEHEVSAPFARRRKLAQDLLAKQNTLGLVSSGGAMYLMLDVRATGLDGEAFAQGLLDNHRIAVMPGRSFGQAAAGHVRVAMTVDDERFEGALKTMIDYAQNLGRD